MISEEKGKVKVSVLEGGREGRGGYSVLGQCKQREKDISVRERERGT